MTPSKGGHRSTVRERDVVLVPLFPQQHRTAPRRGNAPRLFPPLLPSPRPPRSTHTRPTTTTTPSSVPQSQVKVVGHVSLFVVAIVAFRTWGQLMTE